MEHIGILIGLLVAHVIGDFYLQPASWVNSRNTKHLQSPALYLHALLHGVVALLLLIVISFVSYKQAGQLPSKGSIQQLTSLSIGIGPLCIVAIAVLFSHFIIDAIKSYAGSSTLAFAIDQAAHVAVLVLLWAMLTNQLDALIIRIFTINHNHLAVFLAYLVILQPTSIFIKQLLSPWTKQLDELNKPKEAEHLVQLPIQTTLAMAGQRIGYLERLLMLTFVLMNQFAAIGFLIAAKSIFRFGNLTKSEDKKLTEYVLLGTFTSVAITIAIGLFTHWYISTP